MIKFIPHVSISTTQANKGYYKKHSLTIIEDDFFYARFLANGAAIQELFFELYTVHPYKDPVFQQLLDTICLAYLNRDERFRKKDITKAEKGNWFLQNDLAGMSLYVDRFCGTLKDLEGKLVYFKELGVNLLHLMPLFESPEGESDGGYAVSDFRKIDPRFGTINDLQALEKRLGDNEMYLMSDIVFNHTSHLHQWALNAKKGDKYFQDFFYMYDDRKIPDQFEKWMPEVFPESAAGNFTYVPECNKWVMTVFHNYQWDLNYTNPAVFVAMLDTVFFYANMGVDILRIDAPAFIWKQICTTCQNLPQAHTILQLLKHCVQVAAPGMALLGEAIVSPRQIMQYFGTGCYKGRECDLAYNATQMALQWDALATGDTRVMLAAQHILLQKPPGTSWITYTRCHDDIGLGYDDEMIQQAGFDPVEHRRFLQNYYTGNWKNSTANGALFSYNPKTGDARISGTLASLCGLETAFLVNDDLQIELAIQKIIMMQAMSFFIGGLPMLFYGDEVGYTNDYTYLQDEAKSYDNRWMHRPVIDWKKNSLHEENGTIEERIFSATQRLLLIRKNLPQFADNNNVNWIVQPNHHIACFIRTAIKGSLFCLFNFSLQSQNIPWRFFIDRDLIPNRLLDHWSGKEYFINGDHDYLSITPYSFCLMEEVT